jgi:phosphinothricin acetyltransferase
MRIRTAEAGDAEALRLIYRPYVESTAVSFETEVPTVEEFVRRIAAAVEGWAWLVAESGNEVVGYAYGSSHRPRRAYRFSVEVSAYVDAAHQRRGIARALYNELFPLLDERGYHNAYAGITLPNEASVGFHRSLGFRPVGVFPEVGRKFDAWHDVAWLYRPVKTSTQEPAITR